MEKKYRVAVVDDVPELCSLVKLNLELTNEFEVSIIKDPHTVEQLCEDQQYDLVLVDLSMPERDGYSIINGLKDRDATKNIPIIMMSGWGNRKTNPSDSTKAEGDESQIQKDLVAGFLEKPFQADDLVDKVKEVLGVN